MLYLKDLLPTGKRVEVEYRCNAPKNCDEEDMLFGFAIWDGEILESRQHNNYYTPWNSEETLAERQARDKLKDEYCKEHNIRLIRIPYEKRDTMTLQDLGW